MSPEQASSSGEDIDTRSDVYSLGIIFYELLAGAPPIELRKVALEEFLRRLREEEPLRPSTKISSGDASTSTEVALNRKTEPTTLARQLRGELDSIALKALTEARHQRGIRPRRFADRVRPVLLLATKEYPAPSLGEVAQRLGYSTTTRLYAVDSELCKTIVRRFNKSGRSRWWKKRGAKSPDDSIIRQALEKSLALDIPLPVHRSAAALGYQTEDALSARFPDLCRAIKTKRAKFRAARRDMVAAELEAALGEDSPPTIQEVARRLGYNGTSVLRETEPELCAKFVARRREIVEDSRRELGRRLEAVLQENPPPSMSQVRARFGITPSTMHRRFPEIRRATAARHQEFRDSTIHKLSFTAEARTMGGK